MKRLIILPLMTVWSWLLPPLRAAPAVKIRGCPAEPGFPGPPGAPGAFGPAASKARLKIG